MVAHGQKGAKAESRRGASAPFPGRVPAQGRGAPQRRGREQACEPLGLRPLLRGRAGDPDRGAYMTPWSC